MRSPDGYAIAKGSGRDEEHDTFTCCHCNKIVFVRPGKDPAARPDDGGVGGVCLQCCGRFDRGLVCAACEAEQQRTGKCVPFEKRLELMESRDRFLRSVA